MSKYKLIFASAFLALFVSSKSYAIEHVVSLGAGASFTQQNLTQRLTKQYTDTNPPAPTIQTADVVRSFHNEGYSPEINLEYQARFQYLSLGIGVNNSNPSFETTFDNDVNSGNTKIKLKSHYIDTYVALFGNIIKTEKFGLSIGAAVAVGYFNIDKKDGNNVFNGENISQVYIAPRVMVDGEYNFTKHFAIFSRFTLTPVSLFKKTRYNTNLHTAEDQVQEVSVNGRPQMVAANIINNTIESRNATSLALNFGIRYKF